MIDLATLQPHIVGFFRSHVTQCDVCTILPDNPSYPLIRIFNIRQKSWNLVKKTGNILNFTAEIISGKENPTKLLDELVDNIRVQPFAVSGYYTIKHEFAMHHLDNTALEKIHSSSLEFEIWLLKAE